MIRDLVDMRVLGAVRLIDPATKMWIDAPLDVTSPGVKIIRNLHSAYVIAEAPGFESYETSFQDQPATIPLQSRTVTLTIEDQKNYWLARTVDVKLPRDPDPKKYDQPASLFQAIEVPVYPSPIARRAPGVALLRVSVKQNGTSVGLGNALLRVTAASDGSLLARGLADDRGEALVMVPGLKVMTWDTSGGNAVLASTTAAKVTAIWDPSAVAPVNPDDLEANMATLKTGVADAQLAPGQEQPVLVNVTV